MSLTYDTYVTSLANLLVVPVTDAGFVAALPNIIDDAEQRCYRDLDLLATINRDSTGMLTAGNRNFTYPSPFVVTEDINVITPAGTVDPESGTRNSLLPASKEMLDVLFPSAIASSIPQYFAMITQSTIIVGPWPDASYQVEIVGTIRPAPISLSNQTTFLSLNLPDLFLAASLIFGAGYQKNFSEMGDQPQSLSSWEAHYQMLLKSALTEETRKKFSSEGWSSKTPDPVATPPRT